MKIYMKRLLKICQFGCLVLASSQVFAQVTGDQLVPPMVNMTQQGWNVGLQKGSLSFGLPLASVPGEVPIPVSFGLQGTYTETIDAHFSALDLGSGGLTGPRRSVLVYTDVIRPMVGGIHFGYISDPTSFDGVSVEGLTIMESGLQIRDGQWTAFSSAPNLGTVLNLPQAYRFTPVDPGVAKADPSATYLSYTAGASAFGSKYQAIVQGLAPTGFGTGSTTYKVVLDKNKARIFAYAGSVHAWIPILWADRFGHYVTFTWNRATTGLPAGITAITEVRALNERATGLVMRWADYSDTTQVNPLLRLDYVGIHRPSVLIQGYSGYAALPPVGNAGAQLPYTTWVVVPSIIGSMFRPTSIEVGPYGQLSQPSWSGALGGAMAAPAPPPADGTSDTGIRTWTFAYDANRAEVVASTQPNQVTTTFVYTNYPSQDPSVYKYKSQPRGVSELHEQDALSHKQVLRWTRTFPTSTTPLTVKVEGWWDPDKMATPDRYHLFTYPTDSLNYGNGVYQVDALLDAAGKPWRTATSTWNPNGSGLNAGLSSLDSITVQQDGAPTLTTALGYLDNTRLQTTQQTVSAGSKAIASTKNTYASRWDMLEGHQLIETDTTRYAPDGTTKLGTVVQKNVYDQPTSGYPLLQLQTSYLDGGSLGQHGTAYGYDTEGRPYVQNVYHLEGTTKVASPKTAWVTYDPATGAVATQNLMDQTNGTYLTQAFSKFNTAGQPTLAKDPKGITTAYAYDDRGRVLSASRPGAPTVTYAYPDEYTVEATANGLTTTTSYDGFGRVVSVKTPTGFGAQGQVLYTTQTPSYDAYGREVLLQELSPAGTARSQGWAYDILDRLVSRTPLSGGITTLTYGVEGINATQTTRLLKSDGSAIQTTTKVNPLGQTVEVDAPDGSRTTITYDQFGNRSGVTLTSATGVPQARAWNFDALDRLSTKQEPETHVQTFTGFNALNEPTQITEAAGTADARIRNLTYDGLGRLTRMSSGPDSLAYLFSGTDLFSVTRTSGGQSVSTQFQYQGPAGQLSSETTTQPGLTTSLGYAYDALGRLQTLTYPDGRVVGYGYDPLGRVTSITQNGASLVDAVRYGEWGNRWQTQFASGAQDQWDATVNGAQLSRWSIGYVGGGPEVRTYGYDPATNVLTTAGEWTLQHDDLGHLTEADGFGLKTAHQYDAFGNDIGHQATPNPNPVPPTFNNFQFNPMPNNQIPGQEANGAPTGWNTNLRGEATQVGAATASSTVLGLGWDGLGVVSSVVWNGGSETYLYNGSGLRVSLTDAVSSLRNRKYAYTSGGLLLAEYLNPSGTPTWKRDVVYLGSEAVAEVDVDGVHELHSDHLGSPRLITKGAGTWAGNLKGTPEGTQAFGPYGELMSQTGYVPLTGYTGHLQTDPSGLIYMRGRYYSPAWHAFVNSDQGVDPSTWNQRAYVGGSPFMGVDPSGMKKQIICIGDVAYEWDDSTGKIKMVGACIDGSSESGSSNTGPMQWWQWPGALGGGSSFGNGSYSGSGPGGGPPPPPQTPQPKPCNKSQLVVGLTYGGGIEAGLGGGRSVSGGVSAFLQGDSLLAPNADVGAALGMNRANTHNSSINLSNFVFGASITKIGLGIMFSSERQSSGYNSSNYVSVTIGVVNFTSVDNGDGTFSYSISPALGFSVSAGKSGTATATTNYNNCN